MMQHVMYEDIMEHSHYVEYPYFDAPWDITKNECLYSYALHKETILDYLDEYAEDDYLEKNILPIIKDKFYYGEENTNRLLTLMAKKNPSVRLSMYSGAVVNRQKVFDELSSTDDIKMVLLQFTGELNATAIDGLFSLYACSIRYFEKDKDSPNIQRLQDYYKKLKTSSYVYMKKGYSTGFFLMPLEDLSRAVEHESVAEIMESASRFFDVYIENNSVETR